MPSGRGVAQGLGDLGAVAVEREGLEAPLPCLHIDTLDFLDGDVVGQVDGLRDGAGKERLGGGHHPDVGQGRDKTLADLAALVGAVEDGQVLGLEMRGALHGHVAAGHEGGLFDLLVVKPDVASRLTALDWTSSGLMPSRVEALFAQRRRPRTPGQVHDPGELALHLLDLFVRQAFGLAGWRRLMWGVPASVHVPSDILRISWICGGG